LNPLSIRGALGLGLTWSKPSRRLAPGIARNQSSLEAYWRVPKTPNRWIGPGLQVTCSHSFNPYMVKSYVPSIKFRFSS
jgi:hypothetical protein